MNFKHYKTRQHSLPNTSKDCNKKVEDESELTILQTKIKYIKDTVQYILQL